jgi:hypothetical protein
MALDADMNALYERYKRWGETVAAVNDNDFSYVDGRLKSHCEKRATLFCDLINAVNCDANIDSSWDNLSELGLSLHEQLVVNVNARINQDLLSGIGWRDFSEGELNVWQKFRDYKLSRFADALHDIRLDNVERSRKLEEDLKAAREDASIIEENYRTTFGQIFDKLRDLGEKAASIVATALIAIGAAKLSPIAVAFVPMAKDFIDSLRSGTGTARELIRKKRVSEEILITNLKKLNDAKDEIGDGSIKNILDCANKLIDDWTNGARGDYCATDWIAFAKVCRDAMKVKADQASECAKYLFVDMDKKYRDTIASAYLSLWIDPENLEKFNVKFDDAATKMFDQLAREMDQIDLLKDNSTTRSARELLFEIKAELEKAIEEHKTTLRGSEKTFREF